MKMRVSRVSDVAPPEEHSDGAESFVMSNGGPTNVPDLPSSTGVPPFDADKYRAHVADLDISEDQKTELLCTLYWIMAAFVDLGFNVDSVQRVLPAFAEASLEANAGTLEQNDKERRGGLNDATPGGGPRP